MARSYKRGYEFPHEGFVQSSIEAHFRAAGFEITVDQNVDLQCFHPTTGEFWHIEAKGQTTQIGLDFRTGLGQLLQGMHRREAKHAIALPDVPAFHAQVAKMNDWVISSLGIHWLFVARDGSVRVVIPAAANPRAAY